MGDQSSKNPSLHFVVHAMPAGAGAGPRVELHGATLDTVHLPSPPVEPMNVSFEQAAEALGQQQQFYFEPDGSFSWAGGWPSRWLLEGCMYDRNGRVLHLEVKGWCPPETIRLFEKLLATPLLFQLPRQGVYLNTNATADLMDAVSEW